MAYSRYIILSSALLSLSLALTGCEQIGSNTAAAAESGFKFSMIKLADSAFTPRSGNSLVAFHDRLFSIGGAENEGSFNLKAFYGIYSSRDGRVWDSVEGTAPMGRIKGAVSLVFHDKIWIFGGENSAEIWNSDDGLAWQRKVERADWGMRSYFTVTEFKDSLWLMGGVVPEPRTPELWYRDVWKSGDGITWSEVATTMTPSGTVFWPRAYHSSVVFQDRMYLMLGIPRYPADMVSSTNGTDWTAYAPAFDFQNRSGQNAFVKDGSMFLMSGDNFVSGRKPANVFDGDILASRDGAIWSRTRLDAAFPGRMNFGLAVFNGDVIVAGGQDTTRLFSDVWALHIEKTH